mmetsp:Transcript_41133/g.88928  ORF Transcript_41133/g.88928 Transcript_41133/m.88928 type:complete len:123 (-) Transcript_41133:562-930(-)
MSWCVARGSDMESGMATMLFYLSDGFDGGETAFPYIGSHQPAFDLKTWCQVYDKVTPVKGRAVLFYNMKPEGVAHGQLDFASAHGSCDVTSPDTQKWAANYWIRNGPFVIQHGKMAASTSGK